MQTDITIAVPLIHVASHFNNGDVTMLSQKRTSLATEANFKHSVIVFSNFVPAVAPFTNMV